MKLPIDELEKQIRNNYMLDQTAFMNMAFSPDDKQGGLLSNSAERNPGTEDKVVARQVIECEIAGMQALLGCLDDTFQKVVDILYTLQGKVLVSGIGKSGYVARKFATTLASTGTPSFFLHPAEAGHGDLGMIASQDVLILLSNSGNTVELYPIVEHAKRLGVTVIGMTRGVKSKIAELSDISIIIPLIPEASEINAPTTSAIMMMAYGDAVAVALQRKRNFTVADYRLLHPAGSLGQRLKIISEVMHSDQELPLIRYNATLADAVLEISKKRLGCVGVIDEQGDLIGMVTDGDLRRHITLDLHTTKVEDVMTANPRTFARNDLAAAVLNTMTTKKITNAFVTEERKPIGVVHIHDLLKV